MILLIKLLLAHLLGDFLLQPAVWVADKEANRIKAPSLYLHILLHGTLAGLILWEVKYWIVLLPLMLAHGAIDLLKLYAQRPNTRTLWFFTDQALHLLALVVIWRWWTGGMEFWLPVQPEYWLLVITAVVFLTTPASMIIRAMLDTWTEMKPNGDQSLAKAGFYIGILERLFVFTFILTGHWSAVGFLVTAKSVFRFGDLRESGDRKLTEYVLIGTLLSFGLAVLTALITRAAFFHIG